MHQNAIYICISWYSKICYFPIKNCWCQQNPRGANPEAPLRGAYTPPHTPIIISTKVRWLRVTTKQIRPSYRFSNSFDVRLKLEIHEFSCIFWRFFDSAHLPPVCEAPIWCEIKGIMQIHNRGKFHGYSICGCQVIKFQMFSNQPKMPCFGAFG